MAQQVRTRTIKISTVMRSAAFVRGFKEAQKGIPMDYDAFSEARDIPNRWNYERGRQFGFVYRNAIKDGAKVRYDAVREYAFAMEKNWVR